MSESANEISLPNNQNANPNSSRPRPPSRRGGTNDEIHAIYDHEASLIDARWIQIGQFQTLPKRLFKNVDKYVLDHGDCGERLDDKIINELKVLFKRIRSALKVVERVDNKEIEILPSYFWLEVKAKDFLKRLSHDTSLKQSLIGAKRFRKYERAAKTEIELRKSLFDSVTHDLGNDWCVECIASQQQLLDAGKALNVCVKERGRRTKSYFKRLANQESIFWLISNEEKPYALLEVRNPSRKRKQSSKQKLRKVEEFSAYDNEEPELPLDVAKSLVKRLRLDPASCDALIATGVFPEFEFGVKNPDIPDAVIEIGKCTYEAWFISERIVLCKYQTGSRGNPDLTVWGYFVRDEEQRPRYGNSRMFSHRWDDESEDPLEQAPLWGQHSASQIEVDELADVLAHYVCATA